MWSQPRLVSRTWLQRRSLRGVSLGVLSAPDDAVLHGMGLVESTTSLIPKPSALLEELAMEPDAALL